MAQILTWKPHNCRCIIEEFVLEPGGRKEFLRAVRRCAAHEKIADEELYGVLLTNPDSECEKMAAVHKHLLETENLSEMDINDALVLRKGIEYSAEWDDRRNIVVTIRGARVNDMRLAEINGDCDGRFGMGCITVR